MEQIPNLDVDLNRGLYSEDEQAQILSQIEQAASAGRMTVDTDVFRPRKRGILFPVLVNVVAVVLIVGAWFAADTYFQTRQKGLSLRTDKLFSAESKLLAKVLEDAKAQMAAANAEIDKIQGDLQKAATDKAVLQKSFENRVAAQDKALRQEMADALAAEKARLQASGLNADEVNKRLQNFEAQKNNEFNSKLDEYRKQAQAEIDQRGAALAALQTKLQSTVSEQEKLRQEVEKQTKEREVGLQSQLSSQAADLDTLKKERDDLNQFFRQADASMGTVKSALEAKDWGRAQSAVAAFKQLTARASSSSSEGVRVRAQAQSAQVESLELALTALDNAPKTDSGPQLEALRLQAKKDLAQAASELADSQKAAAESEGKWREAAARADSLQQDVDSLVAKLNQSTTDTFESGVDVQYLTSRVAELQRNIDELTPYQKQAADLAVELDNLKNKQNARKQALQDIKTFTAYLRGLDPSPNETRVAIEKLSRTDAEYAKVVEDIQALSKTGEVESAVNTAKSQLYGTVAAVTGTKVVLEPLTKAKPEVGQMVELRRQKGKNETVLGQGPVLSVAKSRVEVDWSANTTRPLSGDAAYLVLP